MTTPTMIAKPDITIHMGAAHNSVTVDGRVFDRSKMDRKERRLFRGIIVGALEKSGAVSRSKPMKPAQRRSRRRNRRAAA